MLVSYAWLNAYFDNTLPSPDEVADRIHLQAFQVESVVKSSGDTTFDLDVLPNRGADSLCYDGIAREVGVIFDKEPHIPRFSLPDDSLSSADYIAIHADKTLVNRVSKRYVKGISVGESPQWLTERLKAMGQQSINNVVDITNYVMFVTGQPIHAFDFDTLVGRQMTLRYAREGEHVTLLDGVNQPLDKKTLVWADDEGPLDVAGIKGGIRSGVGKETTSIVLSACHFDPVQIRKTRQRLKLMTDASRRFEQGVTVERTCVGIEHVSKLLKDICNAQLGDVIDMYSVDIPNSEVVVTTSHINKLLGTRLSDSDVERILSRFKHAGFSWKKMRTTGEYTVVVPIQRPDVSTVNDVVEEVGRIYGYSNIKATLPSMSEFTPQINHLHYYLLAFKKFLVEAGFSEVYNYIMGSKGEVEVENSLIEGMEFLRTDLSESIRKNLILNAKNAPFLGLEQIKLFEINKAVDAQEERWVVAIGVKDSKGWKGKKAADAVKEVEQSCNNYFGIKAEWKVTQVSVPTQEDEGGIGFVAELDLARAIEGLKTPSSYQDIFIPDNNTNSFKPFSSYPFALRDIALWVPKAIKAEKVEKIIQKAGKEMLVRTTLFDTFSRDNKVSYAFRLVFQSADHTLSDKEINSLMETITEALKKEPHFEIR